MFCWDLVVLFFIVILAFILFFLRGFQDNKILNAPSYFYPNTRRIRIILPTGGSGLIQDAKIYQSLIPNSYIVQVDRNSPDTHPEAYVKTDVNLYLESIHGRNQFFPAEKNWLMVNQEYFFPYYAGLLDVLITKSRYAEKILSEYVKKLGLSTRVVYLGHTSLPLNLDICPASEIKTKDWHLLVHLAGWSRQKGTKHLIRLWQKEKGFRHLVPDSRLIITCRGICLTKIYDELYNLEHHENYYHDPETGLSIYSEIDEKDFNNLRQQAGAFICPSFIEGYGHYINEGSANGAVVITSDFPPMNELLPRNKMLISPLLVLESWQVMEPFGFLEPYLVGKHLPTSQACFPDFNHLGKILEDYFVMPDEEKQELGYLNHQYYLQQQVAFKHRLTKFLDEN